MPAFEIEIVPPLLTRSIPLAQAAIGNTNANSAKTNTRLIVVLPRNLSALLF
jgi:hypothetical protein